MHNIIFFGSFLVFPFILILLLTHKIKIYIKILLLIMSIIFIYARFIEPQYIKIQHHTIDIGFKSDIILIADFHIGAYKKQDYVNKVVDKLNTIDADMILIAGDFTYYPNTGELKELFQSFKDIKLPTYWVLGNHDVEKPGPKLRTELIEALDYDNIIYLNNDVISLDNFTLVGLGSHWNNEDNVSILENYSIEDNIVVLTHNPDTISKYTHNIADITLVGHTHGGQIRVPWLYKKVIPTKGDFDRGLTNESNGLLYITSGIGETGLPMRLLNPPVIDVLHIR